MSKGGFNHLNTLFDLDHSTDQVKGHLLQLLSVAKEAARINPDDPKVKEAMTQLEIIRSLVPRTYTLLHDVLE